MRTTHACIACCSILLFAVPFALTHCSGGSSSTTPKGDGGSQGGSSSGFAASSGGTNSSSGGGSGDDGGGSSSGAASSSGGTSGGSSSGTGEGGTSSGSEGGASSSGGVVTPVPEGGAPSDPNSVTCGAASCNTTTQYCCSEADGGACMPYNSGACASSVKVSCNEAADCASGVCCQPLQIGPHSTSCSTSCAVGYFQVCRTDAECGGPDAGAAQKKCIVQTCPTTMNPGGPTATVEACAVYSPGGGLGGGTWGPLPLCTAN